MKKITIGIHRNFLNEHFSIIFSLPSPSKKRDSVGFITEFDPSSYYSPNYSGTIDLFTARELRDFFARSVKQIESEMNSDEQEEWACSKL